MGRALRFVVLVSCMVLAVARDAAQTKKKPTTPSKAGATSAKPSSKKMLAEAADGAYIADGWFQQYLYRTVAFQKHGRNVVGYTYGYNKKYCFQGVADDNIIHVTDAIAWEDEYEKGRQTGRHTLHAVPPDEASEVREFRMTWVLESFPRYYIGYFKQSDENVKEQIETMKACVTYFNERPLGPPPCGDEALRGTDRNDSAEPKYHYSRTVCVVTDDTQYVQRHLVRGGTCSVENVFALMLEHPETIAPTHDLDQKVEDCGILELDSVTSPNRIKIEIDEEHHKISNYTLPGHTFYPGRVIRQVVEENSRVNIVTTGSGLVTGGTKARNELGAPLIWKIADEELAALFGEEYEADQ